MYLLANVVGMFGTISSIPKKRLWQSKRFMIWLQRGGKWASSQDFLSSLFVDPK
jgi:hypothetical protein